MSARIQRLRGLSAYLLARAARPPAVELEDVRLPFNPEPPVRCYLHWAFPLGILSGGQAPLAAPVLAQHIQLFFPERKLTSEGRDAAVRFLPGPGFKELAALGYCSVGLLPLAEFLSMSFDGFAATLAERLREGSYLWAFVDDFFIPGNFRFLREHFRHSVLIVGYDRAGGAFLQASYQKDGSFGLRPLPARLLFEAMRTHRYGIARIGMKEVLQVVTPLGRPPREGDADTLRPRLGAYLDGSDALGDYEPGGRYALGAAPPMKPGDRAGACGISVYGLYRRYLETAAREGWPIDLRATRLLMEHKAMMQLALGAAAAGPAAQAQVRKYGAVSGLAKRLHLTAFALSSGADAPSAGPVLALLAQLEAKERETLEAYLAAA